MKNHHLLRLILVVSCAHALVHVFELALPSVELRIADYYAVDRKTIGLLSTCWRLPWGIGALGAGWLVDRFGSQRMLAVYLLGCAWMCVLVALALPLPMMFGVMFTMGAFASIYHPAGLTLISHQTTLENRTRALGIHGIFGSAGIGAAPFLAAVLLAAGWSWRQYYFGLAIIGLLLGLVFVWRALRDPSPAPVLDAQGQAEQDNVDWRSFGLLTLLALSHGFVYAAVLSFLPRFLGDWQPAGWQLSQATRGSLLTGAVLLAGCFGQYLSGRVARARILERQLSVISFANVPFLLAMGVAQDGWRALAAGGFAIVHFMHQPVYNSLIAKYTPRRRRSLCYGFSFAVGAGLGSFGAAFNGFSSSNLVTHVVLAGCAATAGCLGLALWRRNRPL